jgi:23S rRNA pseudouridine2604 synthase
MDFPIRINAYLAQKGLSTRRGADNLVSAGKVLINGKKASLGTKVNAGDKIEIRGNIQTKALVYYAYNKPAGIITTMPQKGETDIVGKTRFPTKVFPVGRLDKDSHGLIIMTNDGRITDRLLNPSKLHEKEYVVETDTDFNDAFLDKLSRGVELEDYTTKKAITRRKNSNTFYITLTEGKNRQIRKMCQVFGKTVTDLKRIRVMNIKLSSLPESSWREIKGKELAEFLKSLGL